MHCFAAPLSLWAILLLFPFSFDIHTISICSKSHPILYSPLHNILSFHTCCTLHTLQLLPSYTIPIQIDMPYLGCLLHSVIAPSIIRHVPGSCSILVAMLFAVELCVLPFPPLLYLFSSLFPMLFPLLGMPAFFPLTLSSFIMNIPYICALFLYTYNTPSFSRFTSCLLNSTLHLITLLAKISNLFWEVSFPFFSFFFLQC